MQRIILHIDMDAFFAQVEQAKNPALRGKPVVIGGSVGSRGVVSTCSYEARKYGIHSAMSAARAHQLCPHAIFIGGNLTSYAYISAQILKILYQFTPIVEPSSIDEAYLDITESVHLFDSPEDLAMRLKQRIKDVLQLTCSVGIASNKLLAKTASDMNKPDGMTTLWEGELDEKFFPLHIRKLRGVGPATEKALSKWGIKTIADLAVIPQKKMEQTFGTYGVHLHKISNGISDSPVVAQDQSPNEKSISHEHTLYEDTSDLDFLRALLLTLADKVVVRMKRGGFMARTIRLKLRFSDFTTITREETISELTNDLETILETAWKSIPTIDVKERRIRLIGVGVTGLLKTGEKPQLDLFESKKEDKKKKCGDIVEGIRNKHGKYSIMRAGSLPFRWEH
jgi:DNA polymerase IV